MDTIDLIVRSRNGDKTAREKVITDNIGLVWSIVKRFIGRGCEAEDLFQIGCIGLMKAVDKFDVSYDVKLSTYAVPMIAGEIKRFLRDDSMVKISRVLKENGLKAKIATERMSCMLGREPTLEEVAEEAGLTCEDVVLALEAGAEVESLYKSVYQSDGSEIYLVDKVAGNGEGRVVGGDGFYDVREDKEKEKLLNNMLLKELMEMLDDSERELIVMRYFKNKTQSEIAKQLGISQVQVSRMEKKVLMRLREKALED